MEIGNWVRVIGDINGLPFGAYGKVINIDDNIKVQFPCEICEVPESIIEVVGNLECSPENVGRFFEWMENRGGIAVWNSANLNNPTATWCTPIQDENGNFNKKPNWQASEIIRIITDINDIDVVTSKEIKRFHVATRIKGLTSKVTGGGSRRIHAAVAKAKKEYGDAWYEFDYYDYNNAVICVPGERTPLSEWEVNSGSHLQLVKTNNE